MVPKLFIEWAESNFSHLRFDDGHSPDQSNVCQWFLKNLKLGPS